MATAKRRGSAGKARPERAGAVECITIEGFKSIATATLDLGLLNVFVGANGSGKSSLFEAIAVLAAAAAGRIDSIELDRRGARLSPIGRYATHLTTTKAPKLISLGALSREGTDYRASVRPPDGSNGTAWHYRRETIGDAAGLDLDRRVRGGSFLDEGDIRQHLPTLDPSRGLASSMPPGARKSFKIDDVLARLTSFMIFDLLTPTLRGTASEPMANEALGLRGGRLAEALEEVLASPGRRGASLLEDFRALIEWSDDVDVTAPTKPQDRSLS